MAQRRRWQARLSERLSSVDRGVIQTMDQHTNLMTAIIVAGLCGWGIVTSHLWFVLLVVVIGAAGYYLGATIALSASVIAAVALNLTTAHGFDLTITTALFEWVGYLLVARLGVRHRQERLVLLEQESRPASHNDQVMPWHVSNNVRTSLAAVRFLLFPVEDEQNHQALEKAVEELARIESIFESMDEEKESHTQARPPKAKQ